METKRIRVLVVDDHTLLREGTRQLLSAFPDLVVVGEAVRGDEVAQAVRELLPDVVLLDLQLPGMNGIEVIKELAKTAKNTRVLVLTAHSDGEYIEAAVTAGANGYLLKTTSSQDLAEAIRMVYAGATTVLDAALMRKFVEHATSGPSSISHLTEREHDVMQLVSEGLSNRAVAHRLGISPRTVEGHLRRIFEKEDVNSRVELVRHAIDMNLVSSESSRNDF